MDIKYNDYGMPITSVSSDRITEIADYVQKEVPKSELPNFTEEEQAWYDYHKQLYEGLKEAAGGRVQFVPAND